MEDGELLAEAKNKEHLQYRYFGPLIPNFGKAKTAVKKENGVATAPTETASTETAKTAASSSDTVPNLVVPEKVKAADSASDEKGKEAISSNHKAPKQVGPEQFGSATPASDETGKEDAAWKPGVSGTAEGVAPVFTRIAKETIFSNDMAPELVAPGALGERIHADMAA